jgi:glycosyltransferase involved in cell wall biosynthesis
MKILISTSFLGGSGGIERHVASTIASLGERHEIDVYAIEISPTGYAARPTRGRVIKARRFDERVLRGVSRRVRLPRRRAYDAYLHYQQAIDLHDRFALGARMVIPCGDDVRYHEDRFDAVLLEAPDNERFVEDTWKAVLLPPPLERPADRTVAVDGVPDEFFLTIFNPHLPRKGLADLREVAQQSPIPIVWCHSSRWPANVTPQELHGIVTLEDRTQEELRFLYERCRAYISFDHNQGFGWSLADALQYGAPTLSRGRGVMSLPGLDHSECEIYDTNEELVQLLQRDDFAHVQRDLGDLAPQRFAERFESLVRAIRGGTPVTDVTFSSLRRRSACG